MLYFFIITSAMLLITATCVLISIYTGIFSITYAIIGPFIVNVYVLVIMGLCTLLMRFLPKKCWNANKKIFNVSKKEVNFLVNKLKIKAWKDRIPEMGCTSGFPKKHISSLEKKYLWKFLQEICYAEVMHYVSAFLGFTVLFIIKPHDLIFSLPILFVNFFLHMLPSLTQRYNRYRLLQVYEKIKN